MAIPKQWDFIFQAPERSINILSLYAINFTGDVSRYPSKAASQRFFLYRKLGFCEKRMDSGFLSPKRADKLTQKRNSSFTN